MIWESWPWKHQLLRDARVLKCVVNKADESDKRFYHIERIIFFTAYAVRKLYESEKLSSSFRDRKLTCRTHLAISDRINKDNAHKIDILYNLDKYNSVTIRTLQLMNVIIHSLVFSIAMDNKLNIDGFYVTSDRYRYERIWFVYIQDYLKTMHEVGKDFPSTMVKYWNNHNNDWEVWQGHGNPPEEFLKRFGGGMLNNPFDEDKSC